MLVVGSMAMDMQRVARDIDIIATPAELDRYKEKLGDKLVLAKPSKRGETLFVQGSVPIEFDTSVTGQMLLDIVARDKSLLQWKNFSSKLATTADLAMPEILYALKNSHKYLKDSPHFLKTMRDIQYLRSLGFNEIHESLKEFYKLRTKETYDYSHPSLARSKSEFFADDGVGYLYDHDTLHECVKTFTTPAFNMIKKDAAEVFCSKEKFYDVSEDVRLATVLEESLVLALERSQISNNFAVDPYKSFLKALEKVCTSISSGWWRSYAYDNYDKVVSMYDPNYVERFKTALSQGIIKPYVK